MKIYLNVTKIAPDPTNYKMYGYEAEPFNPLLIALDIPDDRVEVMEGETENATVIDTETFFAILNKLGVDAEVANGYRKRQATEAQREAGLIS